MRNTNMCVEHFDSVNPVEFQCEIAFIIFRPQTCEVLLNTASVPPQIPRVAISPRRIEWQELQERLKTITQSELHDAPTTKKNEEGTKEYFINEAATTGKKEDKTKKAGQQAEEANKNIKVYSKLLECVGFSWPKRMA
ncbi:hypothetical protein BDW75DRAFT_225445 [Aspergillus navahoensis]